MATIEHPSKRYPSFGYCIICLAELSPNQLTDEHVIPFFLSGNGEVLIAKGSCKSCQEYANKSYENIASNYDFLVPRLLLGLRRRNKKSPKYLPPVSYDSQIDTPGSEGFDGQLAADKYPSLFAMMRFEPAGNLLGVGRGNSPDSIRFQFISLDRTPKQSKMVTTRHAHHFTSFTKVLAKIGYCHAIAELGLEGFDGCEIRSLLAGERDDIFNFVGDCSAPEHLTDRYLHKLYIRKRGSLVTVIVHLFASCGLMPYEVVVGPSSSSVMQRAV